MRPVIDMEELDALIRKYFVKGTLTNNYLLTDDYRQYIRTGELFAAETGSNLGLFLEKRGFYRLYYFLNDTREIMHIPSEMTVVMEILYRGPASRPVEVMDYWKQCGFTGHLSRDCMAASYSQLHIPLANDTEVTLKYADTDAEIGFTQELLENALDRYTGDILSYDEVSSFAAKKNILCAYLEGRLCGALQFELKNQVVWLGHIAVAPGFRGKGIARELVKAYIADNVQQPNTRYQLWVIQDNVAARSLYEQFGFVYANKSTASMLKLS